MYQYLLSTNNLCLNDITGPVDVFDQAIGTHEWAERMMWRYFWNKDKTEDELANEEPFKKNPWYQTKGTPAPRNCKALEAFIEACSRKFLDPANRKKIKDNLDQNMRKSLKKLRNLPMTQIF